jgi:hypothetical protein
VCVGAKRRYAVFTWSSDSKKFRSTRIDPIGRGG